MNGRGGLNQEHDGDQVTCLVLALGWYYLHVHHNTVNSFKIPSVYFDKGHGWDVTSRNVSSALKTGICPGFPILWVPYWPYQHTFTVFRESQCSVPHWLIRSLNPGDGSVERGNLHGVYIGRATYLLKRHVRWHETAFPVCIYLWWCLPQYHWYCDCYRVQCQCNICVMVLAWPLLHPLSPASCMIMMATNIGWCG